MCMYVCMYVCMCIYMYVEREMHICIYIYRERERETDVCIYIYRERERYLICIIEICIATRKTSGRSSAGYATCLLHVGAAARFII